MRLGLGRRVAGRTTTLFYASDVHGSDVCWRKFLNAANFYKADALVLGGDLTGKVIVPIAQEGETYNAEFMGRRREVHAGGGLDDLLRAIRLNGFYPWIASREAVAECESDAAARDRLFHDVLIAEIERWVDLADDRLQESDAEAWVIPGNDDPWFIDEPLRRSAQLGFCDGEVVRCCGHEMLNLSYSNRTPWDSPRELDEDDLYAKIRALAENLEEPAKAIFNLHAPPYESGLDTATELDETLRPVVRGGHPVPKPVGSTAVRRVIEEYQPLLSLHGHIHESRGITRLGRTTAVNSGSEYNSGRLHGVIVMLSDNEVAKTQLVVG